MTLPNCQTECQTVPASISSISWLNDEIHSGNKKREEVLQLFRVINPIEAEKELNSILNGLTFCL
jgi:hypothetical protein